MTPRLNPLVRQLAHSATLEIHRRANRLRAQGRDVVHFGFGESPFPVPPPVLDALRRHAGESAYLPSQGLAELRERAAAYLKWRFAHDAHPARIQVGPGTKELILDALLALEGDLILPAPSWVSYAPQARLLGKRLVWAPCDPAAGYRMTADDLASACTHAKTAQKLLILNSPCNPTGAVYASEELRALAAVARRHNVVVIADEIYAEITFTRRRYPSVACFCPERTLVTTGLSKAFSAGGYRLGILSVPKEMSEVAAPLANIASETFSCVAAPIQHAAVVAFSRDPAVRTHVADTAAIHRMATLYLWRGLTKLGLRCPRPQGAFYLFPDFSPFAESLRQRGIQADTQLCADLLERHQLAMLPGAAFGVPQGQLAARIASVDYPGAAVLRAFQETRPATAAQKRRFIEQHCARLPKGVRRIEQYLEGTERTGHR